jgi:hypothetical protein
MIPELSVTRPNARAPVCILLNLLVLSMAIHIGVPLPIVESLVSTWGLPNATLTHSAEEANVLAVHITPSED